MVGVSLLEQIQFIVFNINYRFNNLKISKTGKLPDKKIYAKFRFSRPKFLKTITANSKVRETFFFVILTLELFLVSVTYEHIIDEWSKFQ